MIVTRLSRCQASFIIVLRTRPVNPDESAVPLSRKDEVRAQSRYNLGMRSRLAVVPLLLSLMLGAACTIAKEHPARSFDEATGAEGLERMFWKEMQAGNWPEIERVLASNYMGVTTAGSIDRTAALEEYRQWKLTDFAIGDLKTELNGPTFIVTYTVTLNGTVNGQSLPSSPQHMMSVWQEHKKGWMMIAHSVSP